MLERVWRKRNPFTLLMGMQTSTATKKAGNRTVIQPQQPHCWAYTLRKTELKGTCIPQCSSKALLTIARTWKQPRCPSANEWVRKLRYVYTMEYYSAIKKNTFESVLMKLEPIIQSEVSQKNTNPVY